MAIGGGRWLPPHSVSDPGSLLFVMGNATFLRNQKGDASMLTSSTLWYGGTIENLEDSG